MIMGWGFFICQTDCKNRKRLTEFWLLKNFIGVHYHGWVDLNQKKLAESCTRHRKFKDNYYVAMETIIPFYVIKKIIFSPQVLWEELGDIIIGINNSHKKNNEYWNCRCRRSSFP